MKKVESTNSMGNNNYKNNAPSYQDEIKIVTNLYLQGRGIVETAKARHLTNTQCFNYVKTGLEDYQREGTSGKHLTFRDRRCLEFEARIGKSNRKLAKILNCSPSTIANELKRKSGNFYSAKAAHKDYVEKNSSWQNPHKLEQCQDFVEGFVSRLKERKESPYSYCEAVKNNEVAGVAGGQDVVTPQTLYNWVERDLIDGITKDDLPYHNRKRKEGPADFPKRDGKHTSSNSIDFRPEIPVDENGNAIDFGNWEVDTLLGAKDKNEPVLLVLTERMTRYSIITMIDSKTSENVNEQMNLLKGYFGPKCPEIFKTITTDNGSEFLKLCKDKELGKNVYYCHPGCPKEKPYVERTNAMIRVYIPKRSKISNYSPEYIESIAEWINSKYRAALNGSKAEALFEAELDKVYAA